MHVAPVVWAVTLGLTVLFLIADIAVAARHPHEPSRREVGLLLALYVGLAVCFGVGIWVIAGGRYGTEFFAGWLTEYSLSVDNLFVFLIIMSKLGVPRRYQQEALLVGIVLALVMRGVFIGLGAAAIAHLSWIFYLFGLFLLYTAVNLAREGTGGKGEHDESRLTEWLARRLPATEEWHGTKVVAREGGRRVLTPMIVVIVALGTTDLLFALDSIPAVYGLTKEPFLVLTANIFALMGLRQLYFLIGGLLKRLVYLSYGLSFLLAFVGVKLVLHAMHQNELPFLNGGEHISWAPDIPTWLSLAVIVATLLVTTVLSLLKSRRSARSGPPEESRASAQGREGREQHPPRG